MYTEMKTPLRPSLIVFFLFEFSTFLVQQNKLLQQKLAKVEENDSTRCEKNRKRLASVGKHGNKNVLFTLRFQRIEN